MELLFSEAKNKGEIKKSVNTDFVMALILKMREMLLEDETINKMFSDTESLMRNFINLVYYGILDKRRKDAV
jgi:hypothetical protein